VKVLDLFAGLKGWSAAFANRGHEVVTVEINPDFNPTFVVNIGSIDPDYFAWFAPDIILASPPCQRFSVATIGRNWNHDYTPKTDGAAEAQGLVQHTLEIINRLNPPLWVMENPRAMLRKMPFMAPYPRTTVTYCQYGERTMKPTDLWGKLPPGFMPRKCKNGMPCHEAAPRGSSTGVQGIKGSANRGKIPYGLSLIVCMEAERSTQ